MQETKSSFYRKNYLAKFNSTLFPDGLIKLKVRTKDKDEVKEIAIVVNNRKGGFIARSDAILKIDAGKVIDITKSPAKSAEVLFNGKSIGNILHSRSNRSKSYSFPIALKYLKKVNHLTFRFSDSDDCMVMREPVLSYDGKVLQDPMQEAVRKVRLGHWSKKIVDAGGVVVGKGKNKATSFSVPQDEFYFILPNEKISQNVKENSKRITR